jgi:hypothetical protein
VGLRLGQHFKEAYSVLHVGPIKTWLTRKDMFTIAGWKISPLAIAPTINAWFAFNSP